MEDPGSMFLFAKKLNENTFFFKGKKKKGCQQFLILCGNSKLPRWIGRRKVVVSSLFFFIIIMASSSPEPQMNSI